MRAIVLGPPGSGKGTQARILASRAGATHISVGALLRAEAANGSRIGRRVAATVTAGDLVAVDDVLAVLVAPLVAAAKAGRWVLDGVPRTVDQASALDGLLAANDATPVFIVALEAPAAGVAARLRARAGSSTEPTTPKPSSPTGSPSGPAKAHQFSPGTSSRIA